MGTITATIAPEALRLGESAGVDIAGEIRNVLAHVDSLLHIARPVAVGVAVDSGSTIPDVGIGGVTNPETGAVHISLSAKASVPVKVSLMVWLPLDLAHELDHSKRILDGPGYGTTLGEALVSEGLADTFALYAYPHTPPVPWDTALQPSELLRLSAIARDDAAMTDTPHVHKVWVYGVGDLSEWAGYTIGASWVRHFLTTHPQTDVTAATELTANKIIGQ